MVEFLPSLRIRLRYFKGFGDVDLPLSEPLTTLVGRNGAGKSNFLEGLHLLGQLAQGRLLSEVDEPGRGSTCVVRGGLEGCTSLGERFFVLGCQAYEGDQAIDYEIALRPEVGLIEDESLSVAGHKLFASIDRRTNFKRRVVQVHYNSEPAEPMPSSPLVETLPADRALLFEYPSFIERPALEGSRRVLESVESFKLLLRRIYVFHPVADTMRRYERVGLGLGPTPLARDGRNLSAVLYALKQGGPEEQATLHRIAQQLRQVPEEDFHSIDFLSSGGDVLLGLAPAPVSGEPRPLVDARLLSDGTLRYLAILTALEVLPEGTTLLLEDVDAGLHPSRLANLLGWMSQRLRERGLRAVVTTNSPALLDLLDEQQLRGVMVCFRDPRTGSSDLIPLSQLSEVDVLLERGSLGDLVTRQLLEQHLRPDLAERRRDNLLRWVDGTQ